MLFPTPWGSTRRCATSCPTSGRQRRQSSLPEIPRTRTAGADPAVRWFSWSTRRLARSAPRGIGKLAELPATADERLRTGMIEGSRRAKDHPQVARHHGDDFSLIAESTDVVAVVEVHSLDRATSLPQRLERINVSTCLEPDSGAPVHEGCAAASANPIAADGAGTELHHAAGGPSIETPVTASGMGSVVRPGRCSSRLSQSRVA